MGNEVNLANPLERPKDIEPKLDKNDTSKVVYGYCRNNYIIEKCSDDVIKVIIESMGIFNFHYLDTTCNAQPHHALGDTMSEEINMNCFYNSRFNKHKCNNCSSYDSLQFVQSYKQTTIKKGFMNNANEYQCALCKYYTAFNVKINIVNWEEDICYVNPFKHDKNNDEHEPMRDQDIHHPQSHAVNNVAQNCPCCYGVGTISIEQFAVYKDSPRTDPLSRDGIWTIRNVFYCSECELSIHKISQKSQSVFYK
eukprot:189474_1